ncbi:MAG: hypothetical protein NBV68_10505 [Erythrobacter sp.]|uniref:hypothetical protein n=1 Tax=Erythrobacter sp. TaxID=1042 RepID=UPI0025E27E04|nr:hypothetical protein [Erythrobacter sp.]MCL9999800.1 hypothetical protein [Erythrobacter sp.]
MKNATRSPLALCAFLVGTSAAHACSDFRPFAIEDVRHADVVFTGTLARYARVDRNPPAVPGPYGQLTIDVAEVIKDSVPRRVELAWFNSTFGIPEQRPTDIPLVIAAIRVDEDMPGPVWRVLQSPCAPPFLMDDTPRSRADVRKALDGGPVPPGDYFALQNAALRTQAEQAHEAPVFGTFSLGLLAAILAVLALAGWRLARRKG